jgi:hypothetical protein
MSKDVGVNKSLNKGLKTSTGLRNTKTGMKTTVSAILSMLYSLGQITLGLLLHPYQTMQSLVRERVFVFMTLLPTAVLAFSTVLWKALVVPVVSLLFSCDQLGLVGCSWLSFISNWLAFFCIFWQVLLLYLLFRFSKVSKHSSLQEKL